jgi:hypothetical protein
MKQLLAIFIVALACVPAIAQDDTEPEYLFWRARVEGGERQLSEARTYRLFTPATELKVTVAVQVEGAMPVTLNLSNFTSAIRVELLESGRVLGSSMRWEPTLRVLPYNETVSISAGEHLLETQSSALELTGVLGVAGGVLKEGEYQIEIDFQEAVQRGVRTIDGDRWIGFALPRTALTVRVQAPKTAAEIASTGVVADAQNNEWQAELIRTLQYGGSRGGAVTGIKAIPVAQRQPALVLALVEEAHRMRQWMDLRRLAYQSGLKLPSLHELTHTADLVDTLAEHTSPVVIPGLIDFIGTGGRVANALSDFGEPAVAPLLVLADDESLLANSSVLRIFAGMLTRPTVRNPLSSDSRKRIVDIAYGRLHGHQHYLVVMAAIRLAVATREQKLIERVQLIASDARVVAEFEVNEASAKLIMRTALEALKVAGLTGSKP